MVDEEPAKDSEDSQDAEEDEGEEATLSQASNVKQLERLNQEFSKMSDGLKDLTQEMQSVRDQLLSIVETIKGQTHCSSERCSGPVENPRCSHCLLWNIACLWQACRPCQEPPVITVNFFICPPFTSHLWQVITKSFGFRFILSGWAVPIARLQQAPQCRLCGITV